jgi:hypothetical protein
MFPVLVFEAIEISQKEINNCDVCRIQMSVIATGLTCGCVSLLGAIALTQSLVADGIAVTRNIPKRNQQLERYCKRGTTRLCNHKE